MPAISWRHNHERLTLPVVVLPGASSENPTETLRTDGLLDTGATGTGIRTDIVEAMRLRRKGSRRVYTANGMIMADEYVIRVGFICGDYNDPFFDPNQQQPYVLEKEIVGFSLSANFAYPLLIGMDVIGTGDLRILRNGSAELLIG